MSEQDTPIELYPLLPLRDVVVFPHMVIPLFVGRAKSIKALELAMEAGKSIVLVAQKTASKDDPGTDDLFSIGSMANVLQMLKLPDGTVKVLVEGTQRVNVLRVEDIDSHFVAEIEIILSDERDDSETEAMRRALIAQFEQFVKLNKKIPPEILSSLAGIDDASSLRMRPCWKTPRRPSPWAMPIRTASRSSSNGIAMASPSVVPPKRATPLRWPPPPTAVRSSA